jgi:hypothetical protein
MYLHRYNPSYAGILLLDAWWATIVFPPQQLKFVLKLHVNSELQSSILWLLVVGSASGQFRCAPPDAVALPPPAVAGEVMLG